MQVWFMDDNSKTQEDMDSGVGIQNPPSTLSLHMFDLDRYPTAVCLDGSPSGYYFKMATDPASAHLWIVHHQGGGWCFSLEDCNSHVGPLYPLQLVLSSLK